jgi:hypothetical protein
MRGSGPCHVGYAFTGGFASSGESIGGSRGGQPPNDPSFFTNHCSKSVKSPLNLRENQHLHCFSPRLFCILHLPLFASGYGEWTLGSPIVLVGRPRLALLATSLLVRLPKIRLARNVGPVLPRGRSGLGPIPGLMTWHISSGAPSSLKAIEGRLYKLLQ